MTSKCEITRDDIMAIEAYGKERSEHRRRMTELKRNRRVAVGPNATFYFENYDTMWYQIHEMLHVEKGGEEQIADELHAYNPLIPQGKELVFTLMFEIEDPEKRDRFLRQIGGIEKRVRLTVGDEVIEAVPETDVERTTQDGKVSSVHFMRFPFAAAQIEKFRASGARAVLSIEHENYGHMAVIPESVRESLSGDFAA